MNVPSRMRTAVERNDADLANHLVPDDDDAGSLEDVGAVAVDGRHDRTGEPARDAAVVVAVILVRIRLPVGKPGRTAVGSLPLTVWRHGRHPAVGRLDD